MTPGSVHTWCRHRAHNVHTHPHTPCVCVHSAESTRERTQRRLRRRRCGSRCVPPRSAMATVQPATLFLTRVLRSPRLRSAAANTNKPATKQKAGNSYEAIFYSVSRSNRGAIVPTSDKVRRQRKLDRLAFEVLTAQHTEPDSWMRWTDWFQLTKAKCGILGLGNTTFSECTKRLLDQGRIRQSQIAKNRFYQAVFTPGNLPGAVSSRSESGGNGDGPVAPALDKAAQALAFLLKKPSNVI